MKTSIFREQVNRLLETKDLPKEKKPSKVRLNEYYRALKSISDEDFIKTIVYLIDEYKFNNFPQIWDFKEAHKTVHVIPETQYHYGKRDSNYSKEMARVKIAWEIMGTITKLVIKGFDGNNTAESCKTMHDFYNKMCAENKIFEISTQRWVENTRELIVDDNYFCPQEFGFPVKMVA